VGEADQLTPQAFSYRAVLAPTCGDTIRPGFLDTQWAVLANGRHFPFYEEPAHNSQALAASHAGVEGDGQRGAPDRSSPLACRLGAPSMTGVARML
jgi:hypothetical protein